MKEFDDYITKSRSEIESNLEKIKSQIFSEYSKNIFGYPPGKSKPGKSPNTDVLTQIIINFEP